MNTRIRAVSALLSIFAPFLAGCGGAGGSASGNPPTVPTPPSAPTTPSYIYTTSLDNNGVTSILTYKIGSFGTSVPAISRLVGPAGSAFGPIRSDGLGNLYAVSYTLSGTQSSTVTEYSTSKGVLTQIRSFSPTVPSFASALMVDGTGAVYLGDGNSSTIYEFAPGASGSALPSVTMYPSSHADAIVRDSSGNFYCLQPFEGIIGIYSAAFPPGGPSTKIDLPDINSRLNDLAIDSSGVLYVAGSSTVTNGGPQTGVLLVFNKGDLGAPIRKITGGSASLQNPTGVAVDPTGNMYVNDSSRTVAGQEIFSVFGPMQNGGAAPISSFSGAEFFNPLQFNNGLAIN